MRTFHGWVLDARLEYLRLTVQGRLHELSAGVSDGIYRSTSRQLRNVAQQFSDSDNAIRQLIENSAELPSARAATARGILSDNPSELHTAWSTLTREERDVLHRYDPFIGNRNGVPHVDRDHYNRKTLAELRTRAAATGNEELLRHFATIEQGLTSAEGAPRRYLALFDDQFRTAVSIGNPDTATNVAVYVAGAGKNPSIASEKCEKLRQAAMAVDPNADTAVVSYSGDRPAGVVQGLKSTYAQNSAPLLRGYQEGLRVTHTGPPSHNTVIGYSYGGVTVGHTAMQPLHADDIVFVGSIGTGVGRAADLRLVGVDAADIDRHVYSTMAEYDSAQLMPRPHGLPPASPDYGGTVFSTDSTPGAAYGGDPWSTLGWNPDDHRAYWDSANQAMTNMGLIVTGHGRLVT